ncbi:hypothetical protein BaRGS_00039645 [Batillaria attramentaria]|uniref:Uncharacterized protein n=1 Tax=Batillaria attramentaria TaxID=370345 RepID=A0ABD0J2E4_9CAEN
MPTERHLILTFMTAEPIFVLHQQGLWNSAKVLVQRLLRPPVYIADDTRIKDALKESPAEFSGKNHPTDSKPWWSVWDWLFLRKYWAWGRGWGGGKDMDTRGLNV